MANKPVSFRLYSSRVRTEDQAGDVVTFPLQPVDGEPHLHAPLHAVLRFGKAGERLVPIKLGARLTEIGTLELWADSKTSEHRWRLQFELRKAAADRPAARPAAVISEEALQAAEALLPQVFAGEAPKATNESAQLARLEQALGFGRGSWPLPAIRRLADQLLEVSEDAGVAPHMNSAGSACVAFVCARFRLSGRRFPHGAGPPRVCRRIPLLKSSAKRN